MPLQPGERIGSYEILLAIGAGGMGEVYRARDAKLGRLVAIKVLPGHLASDASARERLRREAAAAASLDHPFICKVFEIGEVDGTLFLVMEYITGDTLQQRLRSGKLPLAEALRIAGEVAEALEDAHNKRLVHRDLKPANIMLSQGRVKVMDFGLAKQFGQAATPRDGATQTIASPALTEFGAVIGTPDYMSPEQVKGEPLDGRSDLFSFGVLLCDLLGTPHPFRRPSTQETLAAILRDPPDLSGDLPQELMVLIRRLLAKSREERYQSIAEVRADLVRLATTASIAPEATVGYRAAAEVNRGGSVPAHAAPDQGPRDRRRFLWGTLAAVVAVVGIGAAWTLRPRLREPAVNKAVAVISIAVLPFVNTGGNAEVDYLSDGITDTLIGIFSTLPGLKVKSSNAVRKYKGTNVDAATAGRELGVGKVVTGRVSLKHGPRGDNLSIHAELVDTGDDSEVWGENFERKTSDILSIQRDITDRVAEKLKVQLGSADRQRLEKRETKNPEAYQLYLKGRYFLVKFTKDGAEKGLAYTRQAIDADPGYALAYEGLAGYYAVVSDFFMPVRDALPKAKAAAMKAIELDEGLAEAHADLASELFWYEYDWPGAEKEFRRALELNPNLSRAHDNYGWYLTCLGFQARGIEEGRASVRLDPLSVGAYTILSQDLYLARRYSEAEEQARRALELDPNFLAHLQLALIEIAEGKSHEAIASAQNARQDEPLADWPTAVLSMAYAADGQRPAAEQLLKEMSSKASRGWVPAYAFAELYAGVRDKARTIDALEKAYDERAWFLTFLNTAPEFDFVRSEARFRALLRRMSFPS